jgi:hypothetical protein
MVAPLFYLNSQLYELQKQDHPTCAFQKEFEKHLAPISSQASIAHYSYEECMLINPEDPGSSYSIRKEGGKLAVYTAYCRRGTEQKPALVAPSDFVAALNGTYETVYLEQCKVRWTPSVGQEEG